jgi:hypothetical protein
VPEDVGEKLRGWLQSPFDFAAFGPRLAVGAILSAPERIQQVGSEIEKASEVLNSPAPAEDKTKMLAAQLETYVLSILHLRRFMHAVIVDQEQQCSSTFQLSQGQPSNALVLRQTC